MAKQIDHLNATEVTLEVLNPVAGRQVTSLPISRRVAELNGKRICLFRNCKRPASLILDAIQESLIERFKDLKFFAFLQEGHADISKKELATIKNNADLVIAAVGD